MNKALIAMDRSGSFRVYLAVTTDLAEEGCRIHETTPLGTAALSRVLTGAGLMGLMLKNDSDKLTIQLKGDGPARELLATASGAGKVKGYLSNPAVELPLKEDGRLNVGGSLGIGTLTVIKDIGLREPYVGKIDLVSGEIAEDLTMYFFVSEQQSSSVALGEIIGTDGSVEAAGGMIIQMMPNAADGSVDALEAILNQMSSFSGLIAQTQKDSVGKTPEGTVKALAEQIFDRLPSEYALDVLEYRDLDWECDCSMERLERVVMSIGQKDLTEIIEEDGQAELVCQFCRSAYHFDRAHLLRLLKEIQA